MTENHGWVALEHRQRSLDGGLHGNGVFHRAGAMAGLTIHRAGAHAVDTIHLARATAACAAHGTGAAAGSTGFGRVLTLFGLGDDTAAIRASDHTGRTVKAGTFSIDAVRASDCTTHTVRAVDVGNQRQGLRRQRIAFGDSLAQQVQRGLISIGRVIDFFLQRRNLLIEIDELNGQIGQLLIQTRQDAVDFANLHIQQLLDPAHRVVIIRLCKRNLERKRSIVERRRRCRGDILGDQDAVVGDVIVEDFNAVSVGVDFTRAFNQRIHHAVVRGDPLGIGKLLRIGQELVDGVTRADGDGVNLHGFIVNDGEGDGHGGGAPLDVNGLVFAAFIAFDLEEGGLKGIIGDPRLTFVCKGGGDVVLFAPGRFGVVAHDNLLVNGD